MNAKRLKFASFLSEHTVEYYLIFELNEFLSPQYEIIIPFYYWASREGNKFAVSIEDISDYKCVAVFPRRPKIKMENKGSANNSDEIFVKINHYLFEYVKLIRDLKIQVLAGVPLVSKLGELKMPCKCAWFQLYEIEEPIDLHFPVSKTEFALGQHKQEGVNGPLSNEEVLDIFESSQMFTKWIDFSSEYKACNSRWRYSRDMIQRSFFSIFGAPYKPFFILYK